MCLVAALVGFLLGVGGTAGAVGLVAWVSRHAGGARGDDAAV